MIMHGETRYDADVLIVGAGPVGLALAGDLGWRGRKCIVVERNGMLIGQPKMDQVGIRTMEFCRRWGIVKEVEQSPYVRSYPQDNVYVTTMNGYELGREPFPAMQDEKAPPESPQHRERCPQNMFDPILQNFAAQHPSVSIQYETRFEGLDEAEGGVVSKITSQTGSTVALRTKFVVGCDGGRSAVREQLGIGMSGRGLLTYTTNAIFRCAAFNQLHDKAPGYRYMFVGPNGVWATIVAINGADQWRMSIIGSKDEKLELSSDDLTRIAHRLMGAEFPLEILNVLPWARYELVAESYQAGRVFLAGDACHLTSPTGGLGMNTGIGDAVDIAWKIDGRLAGWGGQGLTDSYTVERRPIAQRITQFSTSNLQTMQSARSSDEIYEASDKGDAIRERVGRALSEGLKREWHSMNMHLGNRYTNSPIIVYNEAEDASHIEAEYREGTIYSPSSRPGCRAPHAWIRDGESTLDLFGVGFSMLCLGVDPSECEPLLNAAERLGVPVKATAIHQADIIALYEKPFVLVRPDGHVAWRGDAMPPDPVEVIRTLCGLEQDLT